MFLASDVKSSRLINISQVGVDVTAASVPCRTVFIVVLSLPVCLAVCICSVICGIVLLQSVIAVKSCCCCCLVNAVGVVCTVVMRCLPVLGIL